MNVRIGQRGTSKGRVKTNDFIERRAAVAEPPIKAMRAPKVFTVREVAKILRLGKMSVYEAVSRREIPCIRIGRRILIPRNAWSGCFRMRI